MTSVLRLMGVLAHPDDESLGCGGAFARYGAEGVELGLVTATRGEGGRHLGVPPTDPGHPGREKLGAIREAELRAAALVLGIRDLTVLGYPDGRVDEADPREAVDRIARELRRFRPQVVLTFPPDGAYGHPDHIAVSQFATAAIVAAADSTHEGRARELPPYAVSKLYYVASDQASWSAYQDAFKKLTSTVDGVERQAIPWPEWQITTEIDTHEQWTRVWQAVSCHASQVSAYEKLRALSPQGHEALWGRQKFYRAFSTVNGGRRRERDLFEGLREATVGLDGSSERGR